MDADTGRRRLPRPRLRGATWREALSRKQSRLVAEFLRRNSSSKQADARGETASRDPNIEVGIQANLSHDLLYQIFMLLPAESLFRLQFVCKQWFGLINSSIFVSSHAQKSETVLISQQMAFWPRGCVGMPKAYFHFLSLDGLRSSFVESSVDDLGSVRASYDGLILGFNSRRKRLLLMNPVTGKYVGLPLGVSCHHLCESFGIAFCSEAKTYKVVHLFREVLGGVGCEILSVETRKWRRIEEPLELVRTRQNPVSVGGSLHWLGARRTRDCFISLDVCDEKFVTKQLPVKRAWGDRLVEIAGGLGFVSRVEVNALEVWILSDLGGECWIKKCRIDLRVDFVQYCVPVCSRRDGKEMVLECVKGRLCVYDFGREEMRLVSSSSGSSDGGDGEEPWLGKINRLYLPHWNTLVSCGDQSVIT
ncbi:F-box protein At5g49610-like [Salvia hispanica]|uniref:F-box protein At5g49610-like n=1 Tax=Salvia hispanica TaxID=49212 RepID=UPI002009C3FE|nr:F-box protein At5g49610-like [Salvia hispanica]